ncbi:transposase [Corynebacterium macginleyi]|nr:transposase [Corynebacterium macginleyi]
MMMLTARFTRSEKDSDEVYGAPRITAELADRYDISLNRKDCGSADAHDGH